MFGAPVEGPANVCCNNQGAVKSTSSLEYSLSKKHNAIDCHAVYKACAAGIGLGGSFHKATEQTVPGRLLACLVWGSFAHEEWLIGRKWKHIKHGAASWVSFPIKGAGTSWVGVRHQGHQTWTQVLVVLRLCAMGFAF